MRGFTLLVVCLLAGCVEADSNPGIGADDIGPPLDLGPTDDRTAEAETVPANVTANLFVNVTEFNWALMEDRAWMVLEVTVDYGATNDCNVGAGYSYTDAPLGPVRLTLYEGPDSVRGWSLGSRGTIASVHTGPVDSRDVTDPEGAAGGGISFHGGTFVGVSKLTMVGRNLLAGNDFTGGAALTFRISCDEEFDILGARAGSDALLVSQQNMDGGSGVDASEASANVGDQASHTFSAPIVRAVAEAFPDQVAMVELIHPDGTASWTFQPATPHPDARIETGPGTFTLTIDRAGHSFDVLWIGVWGINGEFDLTPGIVADPLITCSFCD